MKISVFKDILILRIYREISMKNLIKNVDEIKMDQNSWNVKEN